MQTQQSSTRWNITVFKVGQIIFVKNTGKSTSQGVYFCWCLFSKSYIVYTHNNPSKCIHQTPRFPTVTLFFSTRNFSLWEACGRHRLHFCVLSSNPSGPWLGSRPVLSSFHLPGSPSFRLMAHSPLPSKLNSHLERTQNNLRWRKWEDPFYRWAFSIPSKLFLNEFLDSVSSCMPWSYWVITSSLRHCGFVRCLKEKVINILETVPDKLGNQMAAENLWNAD